MRARRPLLLPAALALAWAAPAPAPHVPAVSEALGIRRRGAARGVVHLTFDDGPDPRATPRVLELLAARGARATFFLVGEQVDEHPSIAAEIVAAGHAVAVHGHRHRCLLRVTPRALDDDLRRATETIGVAAGAGPAPVYRPPYGVFSAAGLALARRRGWTPWLWSRWGRDWHAGVAGATIARRAAAGLRDGDVLLLHDADRYSEPGCWRGTVEALPEILGRIDAAGLRSEPLPA